jgi:hypothetical protein
MKACAICKEQKPFEDFAPGKNGKTHSYCRPCYKAWAHQNYLKNREAKLARQKEQRKLNPQKFRDVERRASAKNKSKRDRYQKLWAKANPDKRRQYARNWRAKNKEAVVDASHRRRAKIRKATIQPVSKSDLKKILSRPCIYCGAKAEQIDHVVPLVRGGGHTFGNLAPSCAFCNQSKRDKLVIEWKAKKRDFRNCSNV